MSDDASPLTQFEQQFGINRQAAKTSFPSPRVHILKTEDSTG